jgi:hypothetical protein
MAFKSFGSKRVSGRSSLSPDRQPEETPDLGSACNQITEASEHLVVGFNYSVGPLPKPCLHVGAELRDVLRRTGIDEEQLVLADDSEQRCEGGSDLHLRQLFEMIDCSHGGTPQQIGDDCGDGLANFLAISPQGTGARMRSCLRHLCQGPGDLAGVKEQEEIHQPPVVVVHDDVFQGRRHGLVIAVAVGHHPLSVFAVANLRAKPVLHLGFDQGFEVASKLEHPLREEQRIAPGYDLFFVAPEDGKWGGQRCREHGEEIAPTAIDLVLGQVDGIAELFQQYLPECILGLLIPCHPPIVSAGGGRVEFREDNWRTIPRLIID